MDFRLTEEQELLRRSVREFAESVVAKRVEWMEETDETPMDVVQEMAKLGLIGMCIPRDYGGTGMGNLDRMIVLEEISRVSAACAFFLQIFHLGIAPIVDFGTQKQKEKYLPRLAKGELLTTLALTESTGGSDPSSLQTSAVKDGDDHVLNGRKVFITNAQIAHVVVVAARTGQGSRGISTFIVEQGTQGFKVGAREHKFGIHGCNPGELVFENCRVPRDNLLGEEGQGLKIALKAIADMGRTGMAGTALGVLRACLEAAAKHAKQRELYGKPIAELQGIQWPISEIYLDWQAARLLCYQAAWMIDQGLRCDGELAAAKFHATEAAIRSAKKAIDIFGGYGYLMDYPVQRYFRDAECLIASAGTSEVMRMVMARAGMA